MSEGEAYVITQVLMGVASGGTGAVTGSYYPYPRAGKTGTTDDYVDAWYCGYTPALSVSVWMGYPGDYLHPMPGVAGGTYCAPMWGKFMQAIADDLSKADFPPPDEPMVFKPWKGMYATMSPSASESATPTPTATKTIKPTPTPTATKTIKPTPTPTPTATPSVGAQAVTILAAAGEADPPPYDGLLGWLSDLFSGIF
jgi:membrane peptidoglycan carboxypeptidase